MTLAWRPMVGTGSKARATARKVAAGGSGIDCATVVMGPDGCCVSKD